MALTAILCRHMAVAPASAESVPGRRDPRLDSLTGLRFLAAFLVLQHHFTNFGQLPFFWRYTGFGATGVTFFFVLSGFVLTWSFTPRDTPAHFYWRRFARIWPLHIAALLLALPVFYTWRGLSYDWLSILLSVVLLHAWVPAVAMYFGGNPASWSLSCEMFFYAVHPFIVRRTLAAARVWLVGAGAALAVAVGIAVVLAGGLPPFLQQWLLYTAPAFRVGEFLLGVLLAAAVKRGVRFRIRPLPAAGLLAAWFVLTYNVGPVVAAGWQVLLSDLNYLVLPALYGLLIVSAAQLDLAGARSLLRSRPMVLLGQWSYALYLVHATVIYTLIHFAGSRPTAASNAIWLLGVTLVAVGLAALLYYTVERPIESRLRRLWRARPRAVEFVPTGVPVDSPV